MTPTLVHEALLYDDAQRFADGAAAFLREGLALGEPAMAAVPEEHITLLRAALGDDAERVVFADMAELGRNPARIIPAVRGWLDERLVGDGRARFVTEPIWPGRSADEVAEATRHEALLNLAFADAPLSILCPYDTSALDPATVANAACTHPTLVHDGHRTPSPAYTEPAAVYAAGAWPLPEAPAWAESFPITGDLCGLRHRIRDHVGDALDEDRLGDFLVAVNEAASNAIEHGRPPGVLRLWAADGEVVCEVVDGGVITDPLAGRCRPGPLDERGRGLWIINQLCDLSQLRSGPEGTAVRLHMAATG
jgi:anti-sigma regulatory factor (Ser/Thr protein kinase)